MDFNQAIKAHSDWKRKLKSYLSKPDHSLKVAEIAANDKCQLGQWIAGEGHKQYGTLPEFIKLTTEHTRFHKVVADLVRRADNGENVENEVGIDGTTEFSKATANVVSTLVELREKVEMRIGKSAGK